MEFGIESRQLMGPFASGWDATAVRMVGQFNDMTVLCGVLFGCRHCSWRPGKRVRISATIFLIV